MRGFYRDAAGTKWTLGVTALANLLASAWLVAWLFRVETRMPISAGRAALAQMGFNISPFWPKRFEDWVTEAGLYLVIPLFMIVLIFVLQSTYKRFDTLYSVFVIVGLAVLFEVTGQPISVMLCLLGALLFLAVVAWGSGRRDLPDESRGRERFGSRSPFRVLREALVVLFPPAAVLFLVLGVISRAFTLPYEREFWQEFQANLEKLSKSDPDAAAIFRLETILKFVESDEAVISKSMIRHVLLSQSGPTGAKVVRTETNSG